MLTCISSWSPRKITSRTYGRGSGNATSVQAGFGASVQCSSRSRDHTAYALVPIVTSGEARALRCSSVPSAANATAPSGFAITHHVPSGASASASTPVSGSEVAFHVATSTSAAVLSAYCTSARRPSSLTSAQRRLGPATSTRLFAAGSRIAGLRVLPKTSTRPPSSHVALEETSSGRAMRSRFVSRS